MPVNRLDYADFYKDLKVTGTPQTLFNFSNVFRTRHCATRVALHLHRRFQNRDSLQFSPYNITRLYCIIYTLPMKCYYMKVS